MSELITARGIECQVGLLLLTSAEKMPILIIETIIEAPLELCFDLARDIETHCATTARTEERIVAGKTSGLLELGDEITFEAVHFGIRQRLSSKIVEYDRPRRFTDQMVRGAFKSLRHVHEFENLGEGTLMRDTLEWKSPLGIVGILADRLAVERHMRSFLRARNEDLKRLAEQRAVTSDRKNRKP